MKIRPLISALSIASLGIFGVSCKTIGKAGSPSDDGAYVGNGGGSGEYDNVYEMGGGDDASYESADNSSGSAYNYESNDYSSSPAPQPTYAPAPTQPTYTPAPTPQPTCSGALPRWATTRG